MRAMKSMSSPKAHVPFSVMLKKLLILALTLAGVVLCAISPYAIPKTLTRYNDLKETLNLQKTAEESNKQALDSYTNAKSAFDSQHTFEVAYSDIYRLYELLNALAGVQVASMESVDPMNNYTTIASIDPENYTEGSASAIKLSVIAEDTVAGLRILDRIELPVHSVTVEEPGTISLIFLTGGDI